MDKSVRIMAARENSELMDAVKSLEQSLAARSDRPAELTKQPAAVESPSVKLGVPTGPGGRPLFLPCLSPARQGDEKVCRCGLRWDAKEERPHCDLADGPRGR